MTLPKNLLFSTTKQDDNNLDIENYDVEILTGYGLGERILNDFKNSKKSIKIITPYFGDKGKKISETLYKLQNINVEIFTTANLKEIENNLKYERNDEKRANPDKIYSFITEIKDKVKLNVVNEEKYSYDNMTNNTIKNYNFPHTKIIIIDDEILYLGSINLSYSAFKYNIETRIRFKSKNKNSKLISKYISYFEDINRYYKEYLYSKDEIKEFLSTMDSLSKLSFKESEVGIKEAERKEKEKINKEEIEKLYDDYCKLKCQIKNLREENNNLKDKIKSIEEINKKQLNSENKGIYHLTENLKNKNELSTMILIVISILLFISKRYILLIGLLLFIFFYYRKK